MKKLTVLVAAAAGYVLGTRAGRERYEQIKDKATKAWNNPKVQDTVEGVQEQAKHAGADVASTVGAKVAHTASDVKAKVSEKISARTTMKTLTPSPPSFPRRARRPLHPLRRCPRRLRAVGRCDRRRHAPRGGVDRPALGAGD
ncbi:YtxH domain-containing protein [Aeromicrobium sp. UC242_57]|uniref:YtxH domain-containing protein n=1 Tax=Aeromicrobium sp. UC242_57 TaxID=3374624 RepID=UPI0037AAA2F3